MDLRFEARLIVFMTMRRYRGSVITRVLFAGSTV